MKLPALRTMLLLDGLGAIATALMLCVILPRFHAAIGLPQSTLITLGLFGVAYGAYSLTCWKFVRVRLRRALAILIGANTFYCLVSALVVLKHRDAMTTLGVIYFVLEIAIITALVPLEYTVLKRADEA